MKDDDAGEKMQVCNVNDVDEMQANSKNARGDSKNSKNEKKEKLAIKQNEKSLKSSLKIKIKLMSFEI